MFDHLREFADLDSPEAELLDGAEIDFEAWTEELYAAIDDLVRLN